MIVSRRRAFVVVCCAAALVFAACLDVLALGDSDITLSLQMRRSWESPPVLHAYIEGSRPVTLTARRDGRRVERQLDPRRGGESLVVLRLMTGDGDTLASTRYTQSFERGKSHWVAILVGQDRPIGHCIGNLVAIPMRLASDTAFLMYGGLPHGAIC